jgi:asparagine synthase (glutamine-hydrolysing)
MCGIGGMIYYDHSRNVEVTGLKKMSDSIYHRGPDDEGFYTDRNAGLCFRRLSIIDLNTGHQPLTSDKSGMTIVFNGEIYNFLEKRELLKKKGYVFKTATDTEVILHLYEEYGAGCLEHLRGMFAFAIWDPYKRKLFCARDRFGIKPFFYYSDNEKFVFGSEIKVIINSGDVDRTISCDALDSYFAFGHITGDLSIYKSVKKLLPGHYMIVSFKDQVSFEDHKYWEIEFEPDYSKSDNYWREEITNCLSETVKLHMISDVPLGAFLSGGIDSSSVVAMMARNSTQPVKTFSIGFRHKDYDELQYARVVAEKYGCEHHEMIIEPESIAILPKLVRSFDEPFSDSSAIPTYYVSKLARENVTVVLSGDGGDELFAGYTHYSYLNKLHSMPINLGVPVLDRFFWSAVNSLLPGRMKGKKGSFLLSKGRDFISAYLFMYSSEERKRLFLKDIKDDLSNASQLYKVDLLRTGHENDFMSNMQYLDLKTYLVDDILTKVDRASMMNSLEARVPLLDHKFAELTFRIPSGLKFRENEQKFIFKNTMSAFLPESIMTHPKHGFSIPLSVWFRDDLNSYVNDTLLSSNPLISNYLDKEYIKELVRDSSTTEQISNTRIWSLLFFEEWLNQNNHS